MISKDQLWKSIFEDFFPEAILFFFPDLHGHIDWQRGFEMLDKELRELSPESEQNERRVDLLAKVWLQSGQEQWILIHIEVQGYKDEAFARRMFTYYYRLLDRYDVGVATLALLTDKQKSWRPGQYRKSFQGTQLLFRFPVFKLSDYQVQGIELHPNPWAMVMQSALIGLKGKWTGDALLEAKISLYRNLRQGGYTIEQARNLLFFIKYYVRFREKDFFRKFETAIEKIENTKQAPMGILELVKSYELDEARMEGIERGIEQGILLKAIIGIRKMLRKGFEPAMIADMLEVSEAFVLDIQQQLEKEADIRALTLPEDGDEGAVAQRFGVHPLLVRAILSH